MNAPVPPAQVPFMRCSIPPLKNVIFASSPPSSMATSVCGINLSTAPAAATTSCSKGSPSHWATEMPPEPVSVTVAL